MKPKKLYIIQIVLDVLCVLLFSATAIMNALAGKYVSVIFNVICVLCWIVCTILNSIILARIIKEEHKNE